MSDKIELFYFPVRGRGEFLRMLLRVAGQPFDDNIVTFEDWKGEEAKKAAPQGVVPYMIYNGKKYGQTTAIGAFLAQKFGLKGKTPEDGLRVDEVCQIVEDARVPYLRDWLFSGRTVQEVLSGKEKIKEKEAEAIKVAKEVAFPRYLGYLETLLVDNGATGFFVGDSVSVADLMVYDYLETALIMVPDCLAVFPSLRQLRDNVQALPSLKQYLKDRPKSEI